MLALLLLQVLFGRQLELTLQLGRDLALNIRLSELTLERYPPSLISELTGLDLWLVSSQQRQIERPRLRPSGARSCVRCSALASRTAVRGPEPLNCSLLCAAHSPCPWHACCCWPWWARR